MTKPNYCDQLKCSFNIMCVGCRTCKTCKSEPYIIDEDCDTCWNCKSDEGILRWDENKKVELDNKEKEVTIL